MSKWYHDFIVMEIKILGCGSSSGVPIVGCGCKVCISDNPKNNRMRQSVFVKSKKASLLIDFGPDIRSQMLENDIRDVDGVLITHDHADHVAGLDDLRGLCLSNKHTIDLYVDSFALERLKVKFGYLFKMSLSIDDVEIPVVKVHLIEPGKKYKINDIGFIPFEQNHGKIKSLGFRFSNFAYSTDFYSLEPAALSLLKGLDLWIVECIGYDETFDKRNAHIRLSGSLDLVENVKPKRAVFIHMSHEIDYELLLKKLPQNIDLAYDGMCIKISNKILD